MQVIKSVRSDKQSGFNTQRMALIRSEMRPAPKRREPAWNDAVYYTDFRHQGAIVNIDIVVVADKRVFPAMDILKSGTRKEDLLVDKGDLTKMFVLRRILNPMGTTDAIEFLLGKLKQTKTNSEFFDSMNT